MSLQQYMEIILRDSLAEKLHCRVLLLLYLRPLPCPKEVGLPRRFSGKTKYIDEMLDRIKDDLEQFFCPQFLLIDYFEVSHLVVNIMMCIKVRMHWSK